jgi:glycine betaine/proline transport system substrate-binding protein
MKKILVSLIVLFSLAFTSCEGTAGEDKSARLVYVSWARAIAHTHVTAEILTRLGWDVEVVSVSNAAMWSSVASGDADALLPAWLPVTHQAYFGEEGEFTDEVEDLGPNFVGAKLGLVVPTYVDIDSIAEIGPNADKFGGQIIGIDPGAGMMQAISEAIDNNTSGLGEMELLPGSGATMAAALGDAIKNEEWIVVPGWKPHWKFGRWDLKILEDPDGIFGAEETINTVVRKDLAEDKPELYRFLDNMDWLSLSLAEVLVWNEDGMDPEDSAKKYVDENIDAINAALPSGFSLTNS